MLAALLRLRGYRFDRIGVGTLPYLAADRRVVFEDAPLDLEQLGLPRVGVEIPARSGAAVRGRFVLEPTPGTLPPLMARRLAVTLVDLAGPALRGRARAAG